MTWTDLRALQRRAAAFEGLWHPAGRTLLRGTYEVARADNDETARYLCDLHNAFGALMNTTIMLQRRLRDLRKGQL